MHELVFIIFFQFSKSLTSSSASSSSTSSINSISTSFSSSSFSNRSTLSQALPISNCSPANSYIDSSDTDSAFSNANYPSPQPSTSFSSPPPPSNKRRRTSLPTGSTKTSPAVLKKNAQKHPDCSNSHRAPKAVQCLLVRGRKRVLAWM